MHGSTRPRRLRAAPVLVALSMLLMAGCGDDTEPAAKSSTAPTTSKPATTSAPAASSKPGKVYTVEQLAAQLGCTPKLQGKSKGFRQANCTVDGDSIVLLDFETADGQRDWLEYATLYGGVYLVGERWLLSGKSEEYMAGLQKTLGGTIQEGDRGGS
jgi:hypothetical protein